MDKLGIRTIAECIRRTGGVLRRVHMHPEDFKALTGDPRAISMHIDGVFILPLVTRRRGEVTMWIERPATRSFDLHFDNPGTPPTEPNADEDTPTALDHPRPDEPPPDDHV